jgi:hypothetical protein
MKYFVIFLILTGSVVIFTLPAFASCGGLPCDDANMELGAPDYRLINFSAQNNVGEPITFVLEKTSKYVCDSHTATITNEKGKVVWTQTKHYPCPYGVSSENVTSQIELGHDIDNPIIIQESGRYVLKVQVDDGSIQKEFSVRNNYSGKSLDPLEHPAPWDRSPLKQQNSGIPPNEVACDAGLDVAHKRNGLAICVTPETKEKLIQRNWTVDFPMEYIIGDRYWSQTYLVHHTMCAHIGVEKISEEESIHRFFWTMTDDDLEKIPIIKSMLEYNSYGLYSSGEYPITSTVVPDDVQNQYMEILKELADGKLGSWTAFSYDGRNYATVFWIC